MHFETEHHQNTQKNFRGKAFTQLLLKAQYGTQRERSQPKYQIHMLG